MSGICEGRPMTRKLFTLILLVVVLGISGLALAQAASGAEENKPPATADRSLAAQSSAKPDSDYVGTDVCVTCHAEQQKSFVHTIMGNAMAHPKTDADAKGCESCHGPGRAHVEAGGGKDTIPVRFTKDSNNPVEERNRACLSCHSKGNQIFWRGSPHESRAMACVDCHTVHYGSPAERYSALGAETRYGAPLTEHVGTKKPQPELCLAVTRCGGPSCSAPRTCRTERARLPAPVAIIRTAARTQASLFRARSMRIATAATRNAAGRFCGSIRRSWKTAQTATSRMAAATRSCSRYGCRGFATLATWPAATPPSRSRSVRSRISIVAAPTAIL